MTKLEKIRQKIIEAVPEIVALKFGCEITDGEYNFVIYRETKQNFWTKELNERGSIFQFSKPLKGFKIIGRQINLEDILRAVGERLREGKFDKVIGVTDVGTFWVGYNDKGMRRMDLMMDNEGGFINWLFGIPLQDQPEPTINFIYEIFYGKSL